MIRELNTSQPGLNEQGRCGGGSIINIMTVTRECEVEVGMMMRNEIVQCESV